MDTHDFRRLGHELIDWVADYRERIAEYPVMSRVKPGEVAAQLPAEPPRQAEGLATISADLERIVLPGVTHWNHPGWFAYFPSNTDLTSVLADLVSAGLGVQGMSWQTSPAATEVAGSSPLSLLGQASRRSSCASAARAAWPFSSPRP